MSPGGLPLLLGVDGGGSKSLACVARPDGDGGYRLLGRGASGPSNLMLGDPARALAHLEECIRAALADAQAGDQRPDAAVLALAGSNDADVQRRIHQWAAASGLLPQVAVVHDSAPLFAAGTPAEWGVVLIAGTGSIAVGRDAGGKLLKRGGWGHWFGDRGSGYDLGRRALTAASEALDGVGPPTQLLQRLLEEFAISDLHAVTRELVASGDVRRRTAALTPVVLAAAADGDAVAMRIVRLGVQGLAGLAEGIATELGFAAGYPLALAGGVACGSEAYRDALTANLQKQHPAPGPVSLVAEPVLGCLTLAHRIYQGNTHQETCKP